jgi:hypothetical protein
VPVAVLALLDRKGLLDPRDPPGLKDPLVPPDRKER